MSAQRSPRRPRSPSRCCGRLLARSIAPILLGLVAACRGAQPPPDRAPNANADVSSAAAPASPLTSILLPDAGEGFRSLDEFRGRPVLVALWATWCPTCLQELAMLERVHRRYSPDGLAVVGIAVEDTIERVRRYRDSAKVTFPLLVDTRGEMKKLLHVSALPVTFAIGKDGSRTKLLDPEYDALFDAIEGPREWDKLEARRSLELLLGRKPPSRSEATD